MTDRRFSNVVSVIGLVATASMVPHLAEAWRARNWHNVYPVSEGVFEVVSEVGSSAADYWCGAGDFTRHAMRAGATSQVYIWRAIGPSVTTPGRKSVQFSLSPPEGANTSPGFSLSVKAVGDNMTAAAAYQYCFGASPDPFWRPDG